jgi:NAD+ kinase
LKRNDPSVARFERSDRYHRETVEQLRAALREFGVTARFRDRSRVGKVDGFDVVMTVGGDGTLLSASHAVGSTPVFGINSAPLDSVGFLCSAHHGNVRERVRDLVAGRLPETRLARMRVTVDGKVKHTRVLNDVL